MNVKLENTFVDPMLKLLKALSCKLMKTKFSVLVLNIILIFTSDFYQTMFFGLTQITL